MLHLYLKIPKEDFYLACSGGIDSMVALDFIIKGDHNFKVLNINHNTKYGHKAEDFVKNKCSQFNIDYKSFHCKREIFKDESPEEYWRNLRYEVFHNFKEPIITVHHLDDVLEWWILSSLTGNARIMPYSNKNVIRPFLLTSKDQITSWAKHHDVDYIDDPSNLSDKYMRNIVRHKILPHAFRINPGLRKVIRKKLLARRGTVDESLNID